MPGERLTLEGLDGLLRAIGRIDRNAPRELRKELRVRVGGAFVRDVKEKVLVGKTRKLRNSIRPAVRGSSVIVRSTPPLNPGPRSPLGYAAVYEFGAKHREQHAFLYPTLDEWQQSGRLEDELGAYLDYVEADWRA